MIVSGCPSPGGTGDSSDFCLGATGRMGTGSTSIKPARVAGHGPVAAMPDRPKDV